MGRWYLERLNEPDRSSEKRIQVVTAPATEPVSPGPRTAAPRGVVVFVDPELEQLKQLVDGARLRLAELETQYTKERHAVDVTQSKLFGLLQSHYQKRDRLQLIVSYRQKYLDLLLHEGEEEAQQAAEEYEEAKKQSDAEYRKEAEITANCRQ
ncbi:MAG: exonuclease, partial [Planctomyces sp.]